MQLRPVADKHQRGGHGRFGIANDVHAMGMRGAGVKQRAVGRARDSGGYRDAVLQDLPSAYWRFDELTGTVAVDSSGNAHDLTLTGGYSLGVAATDDGDTAIGFGRGAAQLGYGLLGGAFSLEAWVRAAGTVSGTIIGQWDTLDRGVALDSSSARAHGSTR